MTEHTIGHGTSLGSSGWKVHEPKQVFTSIYPDAEQPTLRDRFAMAALTALIWKAEAVNSDGWSWRTGTLAGDAYEFADDMMEARKP